MCHSAENSLERNLAAQAEMLRWGIVDLSQMPGLLDDAENAERTYKALMKSKSWTPEQLLFYTGYHVASDSLK